MKKPVLEILLIFAVLIRSQSQAVERAGDRKTGSDSSPPTLSATQIRPNQKPTKLTAGKSDTNKIEFFIQLDKNPVSTTTATGGLVVQKGVPSQIAVLVDSTNFDSATWSPYFGTFSASLPSTDGQHQVSVGLKGLASDSQQTWQMEPVVLDRVPPTLVVTNPAPDSILSIPYVQLKGYSLKPLSALSCVVSNVTGITTNLLSGVNSSYYDTNCHCRTTNFFSCYDLDLADGTNVVTLRATDLAGNTRTNFYTYIRNYTGDHTPPAISIYWPQSEDVVSGDRLTLRGVLDDPTAKVTGVISNSGGLCASLAGLVERNGLLWIEGMPLRPGTNMLMVTATDAAGNSATTNLTIIGTTTALTINAVPRNQLWQLTVDVSGAIDTSGYDIWVNGVKATLKDDGTWSASEVPLNEGNTAVIQAVAIPKSDHEGNGTGGSGGKISTYQNPGNPRSAFAVKTEQWK
jgi:hypothetical protein